MDNSTAFYPDYTYLIIGTGFSGICMAAGLNRAGKDDYLIFERSDRIGGVWRDNTYPGAACDVPSHLYSFSFAHNPNWTKHYPPQAEIQQYLEDVFKNECLSKHTEFKRQVEVLKWNEKSNYWKITCKDGHQITARYVIAGTGQMPAISIPDIKNFEQFQGSWFHSAKWNHSIDLSDKNVGVVGTGASSIQFIPEVAKTAKTTTIFQRSAPWVIPKNNPKISRYLRSMFAKWPVTQTGFRWYLYAKLEIRGLAFFTYSKLLNIAKWDALKNIKKNINDSALQQKVTPDYKIGCKRILVSDNYYSALASDRVNVVTSEVIESTHNQIISRNGQSHDIDVLILGTGFAGTIPMPGINVTGVNGRILHKEWEKEGAESFFGVSNSGFPNLFTLIGPNSGLGHNSVIYILECQVDYVLKVLNFSEAQGNNYANVKMNSQVDFNRKVKKRMSKMVWQTGGCTSWYHNSSGKNISLWPTYTFTFHIESKSVKESDFTFTPNTET